MVSVDVKNTELYLGTGHSLSIIRQPTSEDIKLCIIIIITEHIELWSCVKVEVAVLGSRP